ncbi:MAG: hypothetical protein KatS3mg091_858 [Patescibacteria group bacterium]|nr:MAG: hypothetical protein KatS3mg091_858 [Patescibacteria group bacterium]
MEIFQDQDILDLVRKYGEKVEQLNPDFPEYKISDPDKKSQFIQEVISLVESHPSFKKPTEEVFSDIDGVAF